MLGGVIFIIVPSLHRRLGAIYTCIQGLQLLDLDCHNEITVSCHELLVRVTMNEMRREIDPDALFHAGNISPGQGTIF